MHVPATPATRMVRQATTADSFVIRVGRMSGNAFDLWPGVAVPSSETLHSGILGLPADCQSVFPQCECHFHAEPNGPSAGTSFRQHSEYRDSQGAGGTTHVRPRPTMCWRTAGSVVLVEGATETIVEFMGEALTR